MDVLYASLWLGDAMGQRASTSSSPRGSVAKKPGGRSARVRRAHHRSQSVQMATLSRRHYPVVCALVSPLPPLGGTDGGDDQRERFGHQPQWCVALGTDLWAGAGQALPAASETHQSELAGR